MAEGDGYPTSVEGLAYRLDHKGCLYCNKILNEVEAVKRDQERLQGNISKAIWIVIGAIVASGLSLVNTVVSAMASKGP